jgi:hypothetical protein
MTRRAGVFGISVALCLAFAWPPPAARGSYVVTLLESGGNVVGTGTGTIDFTDLTSAGTTPIASPLLNPAFGDIRIGPTQPLESYFAGISGPTTFGSGSNAPGSNGSGSTVELFGFAGELGVPVGYTLGSQLTSSATWAGSFSSLGLTPGTYTWTWGTGAHADSFTVQVGPAAAVPEPSSGVLVALGAVGVLACGLVRKR